VGEPHLDPPAVHRAGDQPLAFEGLDAGGLGQPGQLGLAERLAQGDQLQHGPLGISQVPEPLRRQLGQACRGPQPAAKTPDAAFLAQRPALDRPRHQLPQDQRITPAVIGQLTQGRRVHRAAQHRGEQLLDGSGSQHPYLNPLGQGVLPQGHHRVRCRLARPHGDQHRRRPGQGQLVHQGR
jgi:hypothetical protein